MAGVVRFGAPTLSLAPHSVGAHLSVSGLSLTGGGGCCALMNDTPTPANTVRPTATATRDRLVMSALPQVEFEPAPMVQFSPDECFPAWRAHELWPVLPHAARRAVERAGRLRRGSRADARRRGARLWVRVDRRAPLQRLRALPGAAGARGVSRRSHANAAPGHGRQPVAAPPSGRPRRAARGARRVERRAARRRHRPRPHAAGLPDLPGRARGRAW